ncbi:MULTISPECIES: DUF4258 domain-containing protein [Mesorhizobium]|nr:MULTISPECIES: DUF4258 domain-containing protein [Mesorhizobium]
MSKPDRSAVVQFKPRHSDLEKTIRSVALDSKNVRWRAQGYETHCESRMEWRDITDRMMFEVLRTGYIKGDIEPGRKPGEWKVKMVKQMKGTREIGVVTVVINCQRLFVKTVEWEDL